MTKRSQEIRNFIIQNVEKYPDEIAKRASTQYSISRQAVNRHLSQLVEEQLLDADGITRNRSYSLRILEDWTKEYPITNRLAEDVVWRNDIKCFFEELPYNVLDMWHYGFSEMFNNAIDHSGGSEVNVNVRQTAANIECTLIDDGVGIFRKIKNQFDLLDERHAVLELSKGKLTTDPENHSGQSIFFTSRMFDEFTILSGETFFCYRYSESGGWIVQRGHFDSGTLISMKLSNQILRTAKDVFDQFTSGEDYDFSKTIVPVRLAQYERENLISRSQARRLMTRVNVFNTVILDFDKVEAVGQAFADEVFRVFPSKHQNMEVIAVNANEAVRQMISRAKS